MELPSATGHIDDVPDKRDKGQAHDCDRKLYGYGDELAGEPEEQGAKDEEGRVDGIARADSRFAFRTSRDDLFMRRGPLVVAL
jgi:hypothetical protein